MLFTLSNHAQERIIQRNIREDWIRDTILHPQHTEVDPQNPTVLRAWKVIPEKNSLVLRVIYNFSLRPYTVITVFFDRSMRGKL